MGAYDPQSHAMAYVYAACAVRVTIFSTGGTFRPVSNFTELHALTLAARFLCALALNPSYKPSLKVIYMYIIGHSFSPAAHRHPDELLIGSK